MKILVIPDVHLKPQMFIRAKELLKENAAESAVCLMDIPDDWGQQYNLEAYVAAYDEAIAFAKEYPESLWCYGNHDLSYLWNENETGFSAMARYSVQKKLAELSKTLPDDNPIQYIHKVDNVVFCHGGISQYFVEKYVPCSKWDSVSGVVESINRLGHYEMWSDDSPIWYRPQYYQGKMYQAENVIQVVGHTPVEKIDKDGNIISCDVFSTNPDGTPIGSCEFLVIDTKTGEYTCVK